MTSAPDERARDTSCTNPVIIECSNDSGIGTAKIPSASLAAKRTSSATDGLSCGQRQEVGGGGKRKRGLRPTAHRNHEARATPHLDQQRVQDAAVLVSCQGVSQPAHNSHDAAQAVECRGWIRARRRQHQLEDAVGHLAAVPWYRLHYLLQPRRKHVPAFAVVASREGSRGEVARGCRGQLPPEDAPNLWIATHKLVAQ